jgi:hypothetical protein
MDTYWLAALGIFGTLAGTGLGQWMAMRSKRMELEYFREKDQRDSLLSGIRELHLGVIEYNLGLASFVPKVLGAKERLESHDGKIQHEFAEALLTPLVRPWAKMGSLQLLYANELNSEWLQLGNAYDSLISATFNFLNGDMVVADFIKATHELSNRAMEFAGLLTDKYLYISGDPTAQARFSPHPSTRQGQSYSTGSGESFE